MDIVLSGIRPTGNLHLGNYFGALRNFTKMQHENTCYFFIADYHSLTTHPTPEHLQDNVKQVLVEYLAAGLDPEVATIYVQSDLPQTAELYLFLNMNAYKGELERVTTFKEKAKKQPNNINAGLLTYPALMAADILIHRAHKVPVGKDQEQHLEMTRTFANRFNRLYKVDYFPEPVAYNFGEELIKIPGLDGSGKMGKSEGEGNAIFLADEPAVIRKKVMRAVSDAGPTEKNSVKPEPIRNLFLLMQAVSSADTVAYFEEKYNACEIRYGDMKKQLAEDIIIFTEPIRERVKELSADEAYIKKVMEMGKEKAIASGGKTVKEVREIIGFRP
ncbi:MAG TPA: tryptophan--tRNA ligase [Bacteroidales bacterium]|nr:tryptophan--tRNA ligase [Bacteroidales bacterium]HPE57098.1 tryptophan--tRNA ligase [Bacteroidales bacterium]HRX97984.1 tryptophan--tRNA ligase [Bacteroidales bacterium]